jgi:hypothetical protein
MGTISHFDIDRGMQVYNLDHFVETGTGRGDGLSFACSLPFKTLWSSEIDPITIQLAMNRIEDHRVTLFHGASTKMLDCLWRIPKEERILFWLDAHFPGAQHGFKGYADEEDEDLRLPLKHELALIKKHRALDQDVIVIDDARIWLDEPFESGPIPDFLLPCRPTELGIQFIYDLFADSHRIDVIHDDQGYIVLSPYWVSDDIALEIKLT